MPEKVVLALGAHMDKVPELLISDLVGGNTGREVWRPPPISQLLQECHDLQGIAKQEKHERPEVS
jgi:hypothetical protein